MDTLSKFARNHKAAMNVMAIVGLAIGLIVAAAVLPTAIVTMSNETEWDGAPASVITLATVVVPIVAVAALVMLILRKR